MAKFELKLNQNVLHQVAERAEQRVVSTLQEAFDELWATHAGHPEADVRAAVHIHPSILALGSSDEFVDQITVAIANRQHVTFRAC